ncbi:MAG: RHS repeat protein, partial [Bacteroidetes bacterium]|nr:RHS repeat protein [Bacteroidota bacterium]
DIPGGADAVHHGKAIKDYAGMTIQIGPANSDNDFSLGPKSGDCPGVLDDLAWGDDSAGHHFSAYKTYDHQIWKRMLGTGAPPYANVIGEPRLGNLSHHPLPHAFGVGLPWSMLLLPGHHLANAPVFDAVPWENPMFAFWWNDHSCAALTHANKPTLFPASVKLKRVEVWRYSKRSFLLKEVRTYVRNGEIGGPASTGMRLVGRTAVEHQAQVQPIYRNLEYYPRDTLKLGRYAKNVLLLTAVRQAPVDPSHDPPADLSATPAADMPSTVFAYDTAYRFVQAPPIAYNCSTLVADQARPDILAYTWASSPLLTRIVDPLGGTTTIDYNDPTDRDLTETQAFDLRVESHLDTSNVCDSWTRIDQGSITMTPTVKRILRGDETGDSTRVTDYAYANKVYKPVRESPNDHYRETRTEFEDRAYGYLTVTVTGPQNGTIGGDPVRNRTVHRFRGGQFFAYTDVDMGDYGKARLFTGTTWPADSTAAGKEFLLFGKLKDSRQYDHLDRLLIEDVNTYAVSKAFDNGMLRHHWDVGRFARTDDYVDYDTAFTARSQGVPSYLEHGMRPYADNKFLETAAFAFPPEAGEYAIAYPPIYLNSYFIALTRTAHTEHDPEGCVNEEPFVAPPWPGDLDTLQNARGNGWTNLTEDPRSTVRLTALDTHGLTNTVKDDLMDGPLDEAVLQKAIDVALAADTGRLREVLLDQSRLSDLRLLDVARKAGTFGTVLVRRVLSAQPYLSDHVLEGLFASGLPGAVVKEQLLRQRYLSSVILNVLLDADTVLGALDQQEVLLAQGRLPRPVLARLIDDTLFTDPMKAAVLVDQALLPEAVFDSLALRLHDWDPNAIQEVVLHGPRYPDDDFLLALINASPALPVEMVAAVLSASPHAHSGGVVSAVNGKASIRERLPNLSAWEDLGIDCGASCHSEDLAITTYTDYTYYTADSAGVTDAPGYKRLFGFGLDHAPFRLKWQPSWLLFSKKTWSPQYPSAYATDEYYYYQDLLNRYDRHWSVLQGVDGFVVSIDEDERDPLTGLPEIIVYPAHDPEPYRVPDIEAILRLDAFGNRTPEAYQHRSITKNALDPEPLVRNEFRYYFGQWPQLPYPYNTDVVLPAGAPCPPDPVTTGGGGPGSPGHTGPGVAATYRTYGFNDANWRDQLGGVPADYALARHRDDGFFFVPFTLAEDIAAGDSLWTVYYRSWAPDSIYDPDRGVGGPREDIAELDLMKAFQLRSSHRQADSLLLAVYDTVAMFQEEVPLLQFRPTDDGDPATVDLWAPVMPYATLDEGVVLERNAFQQPQLVEDERGLRTRYVYDTKVYTWYHNATTPCHNYQTETLFHPGRPTAIITGCGLPDSLVTRYRYNADNSVDSLIDPNGMVLHYAYDDFGRLSRSYRNGYLLAAQQYGHWANTAAHQGDGFFARAQQNHVSTVQYLEADSALVTRAYVDPLGRGYNTVAWAMGVPDPDSLPQVPAMVSSGRTQYDAWDRAVQRYKPYVVHAGAPFDLKVTSAVLSGTPALYTTAQAEPDPRGRPLAESKVGETIGGAGHWVKHGYTFMDAGAFTCALGLSAAEAHQLMPHQRGDHVWRMAQTIDEDGRRSRTYTNALGQQMATQAFLTDSTAAVTLFLYDSQGQVARTIDPEKHVTYEARNLLGWTYLRATPDGGVTRYMYDRSGNVVLEQNAVDRLGETVYGAADTLADVPTYRRYTYDAYDRLVRQERVRAPRYGLGDRFKVGVVWKAFGSHPVPPLHYSASLTGFEVVDGEEELTSNAVPNPFTHYTFTAGSTLDWLAAQDVLDDARIRHTVACAALVRSPIVEKAWTYFTPPGVTLPEPLVTATEWAYLVGNRAYRRGRLDHTITYPHRRYQDQGAELAWPQEGFTRPAAPHVFDFFSYDAAGRVAWQIQQFNPDGITSDGPGLLAVLDYVRYDLRGNLRTVNIDINGDHRLDLQQHYVYNAWGRLTDVYASHRARGAAGEHLAALAYDTATALLQRTIFYRRCKQDREDLECDRTTYSYDTRDRLRRITARFYTEWLYYDGQLPQHNGTDLQGQHNWDGAINGTRHDYDFTPLPAPPAISGFNGSTWYGYRYDALGRLVQADGIVHDEVASATGPDDLRYRMGDEAFSYDRVGDLRTLQRVGRYAVNGGAQPLEQAWSYGYGAANSRLLHLTALGAPALTGGDYGYDAAGNLLTDTYRQREQTIVGRSDLPWEVVLEADTAGQREEKYLYDVGDQRIYKQESRSFGSTVGQVEGAAWHLRDMQGRELGVLDLTAGTWQWYAFGTQRFARIRPGRDQQPLFYDGDIGRGKASQEDDEYTSLAQCVAQLAGTRGRIDYPVTLVRVVLEDGTVLFLSEAAYAALDSVYSRLVSEHDVLVFESDDDRITVLRNGEEVTMSLREVLDGGERADILANGNGFWYTYPETGRINEVTYYEHDHLGDLRVAYVVEPMCQHQEGDGATVGLTGYRLEHVLD